MSDRPESERLALAMYDALKAEVAANKEVAPRPMLADNPETGESNFDLSKADPDCKHCGGIGHRTKLIRVEGEGLVQMIIICRCVFKGGGVNLEALKTGGGNGRA